VNEACFSEQKGIKTQSTEGGLVFRGFEATPARDHPTEGEGNPLAPQERRKTHDAIVGFLYSRVP
jgi:hypothetical protein